MKKILQVLTDTNIGGAGVFLLNYLAFRDSASFETAVVLPKGSRLIPLVKETGARVIEAGCIADRSYSKEGTRELFDLFRDEKPDLVHTHASLSARMAARRCGIPIVNTRHCLEEKKSFPKNILYRVMNNSLSDRVIAVSHAVEHNLLRDGIRPDKLRVIYNGIPPLPSYTSQERAALRQRFDIAPEDIAVGIVARLEPVKNHRLFLEAAELSAQKNPRLMFFIVGEGSLEVSLRQQAETLSARVVFLGYQSRVSDILCALDMAALTSEKEALSLSLIEAMAMGKPVISTRSGGPEELIREGENGFLCENNNPEALASLFLKLADRPALRKTMGEAGQKLAAEQFTASHMAEQIEAVYRELIPEDERRLSHE